MALPWWQHHKHCCAYYYYYYYYSVVYHYNGAQWYEQFLQIGRLDWALILLGLALWLPSLYLWFSWCYICLIFLSHSLFYLYELSLVGVALDLQCCDTVGWVIWPVKSSPMWLYNVSGGTFDWPFYTETQKHLRLRSMNKSTCSGSRFISCIYKQYGRTHVYVT